VEVQAGERALAGVEGDVGLGDHGPEPVPGDLVLAERAREEPALVRPPLEVDDERALEPRLREDHVLAPCSRLRRACPSPPSSDMRTGGRPPAPSSAGRARAGPSPAGP